MKNYALILLLLISVNAFSQTTLEKTNNEINKFNSSVNNVKGTINNAGESVKQVKGFLGKLGEFIPSKSEKDTTTSQPTKTTVPGKSSEITLLTINNCDYATMKDLVTRLGQNTGIASIEKTFSNNVAVLKITHSVSSESILDFIEEKIPGSFTVITLKSGEILLAKK